MSPSDLMYRTVYGTIQEVIKPYEIYESVPDASAKYPFVWLDYERVPIRTNNDLLGGYTINIRLYGTSRQRSLLNEINGVIYDALNNIRQAGNYHMSLGRFETNINKENDQGTALLHFSSNAEFSWNKH